MPCGIGSDMGRGSAQSLYTDGRRQLALCLAKPGCYKCFECSRTAAASTGGLLARRALPRGRRAATCILLDLSMHIRAISLASPIGDML